MSPLPARDRYPQFRVNKATKASATRLVLHCIGCRRPKHKCSIIFTVHTTFTCHRTTDRCKVREQTDVAIGMHNFSNQKFGGTGRADEPWLSVCTEACRAVHLQIPSFHPVVPAIRGADECRTVIPCIASVIWAFGLPLVLPA